MATGEASLLDDSRVSVRDRFKPFPDSQRKPRARLSTEEHSRKRARGERQGKAKLTDADVIAIRQRYGRRGKGGLSTCALAKEYGVTPQNVWYILQCKTWRHVPAL